MDGIKTAQLGYDAAFDRYVQQTAFHPGATVGKGQVGWTTGSAFDTLGWSPDGEIRGAYKVSTVSTTDFRVTGISDVDGDGQQATYTATKSINATLTTPETVY